MNGSHDQMGHDDPKWYRLFIFLCVFSLIGLLDLPSAVRPAYLTLGVMGLIGAAAVLLWQRIRHDRVLVLLMAGVLLFWTFMVPPIINGGDDNPAYLVFAHEFFTDIEATIQPLSERRLFSVGGGYVLQAPVLHWLGIRGLSLVEPVFGLMLFFLVLTECEGRAAGKGLHGLIGVLGLVPLGGGKVLLNTASVFVLAAFTLAILVIGRRIMVAQRATRMEVLLLVLLPLTATVYRPTTAPFNFLVAGAFGLYAAIRCRMWTPLLASVVGCGVLWMLTLMEYHGNAGTYLYPLLGRGAHITAEGYSIGATVSWREHAGHLVGFAVRSPLFLANVAAAGLGFWSCRREHGVQWLSVVMGAYLVLCGMIVVSTSGLASARYVFPVSLALLVAQLGTGSLCLKCFVLRGSWMHGARVRWLWACGVLACLVLARFAKGQAAIDYRMKTYQPEPEVESWLAVAEERANRGGATLFVHTEYERYLVPRLKGKYYIMDQPGMMSPWHRKGLGYEEGLRSYLRDHEITTIIMASREREKSGDENYSGWLGLMYRGHDRNEAAMRALVREFGSEVCGPFTIIRLPMTVH